MTTNAPIHYTLADGTTGVASSFTDLHEPPPGYVWRNMAGAGWRQVLDPPALSFDGHGINHRGGHAERLATFTAAAKENGSAAAFGPLLAAAPALADALRGTLSALEWHTARHGVGMDAEFCRRARAALALIENAPAAPPPQPAEPFAVQGRYWTDASGNTYSAATISQSGGAPWVSVSVYGRSTWRAVALNRLIGCGLDPDRAKRIVADATETEVRNKRDL